MNLTQGFKMAWKSIGANKLRSFLTMLGIIIGVSAVIALISIGQGSTAAVKAQVQSLGTNMLTVNIFGRGVKTSLSYNEAEKLAQIPGVKAISPEVSGNVTVKNGTKNESVSLTGITPDFETVRDYQVQAGRFILPIDLSYRQKVALLGSETATNIFGTENPVGQTVLINGVRFDIVGLLAAKGTSLGRSNDDTILIPITTAERILRNTSIRSVYVQTTSSDNVNTVSAELDSDLSKSFKITAEQKAKNQVPYRIFNQQDALNTVNSITKTTTMMLGGIAAISLLVGGIGIMNIMLVSVSERTREIGIRKAIGARRRDILIQFLIESMVLGGLGGLIGVGVGAGGAELLSKTMKMSVQLSGQIMLISFAFSLFVGVFFGLLPANKAAALKPIEALRTE